MCVVMDVVLFVDRDVFAFVVCSMLSIMCVYNTITLLLCVRCVGVCVHCVCCVGCV